MLSIYTVTDYAETGDHQDVTVFLFVRPLSSMSRKVNTSHVYACVCCFVNSLLLSVLFYSACTEHDREYQVAFDTDVHIVGCCEL